MEIKKPTIKSIPYEDFKNNEWLVCKAYLLTKVTYKKGLFGKKKNLTVERIEGWAE